MSETAHKINHTFRASFDNAKLMTTPYFPTVQAEPSGDTIQTEAGEDIILDGLETEAVVLQAIKVRTNTFIATGGNKA